MRAEAQHPRDRPVLAPTRPPWILITEFIKDVSPLLPDPCHFQDYDRSIIPLTLVHACTPPEALSEQDLRRGQGLKLDTQRAQPAMRPSFMRHGAAGVPRLPRTLR